MLIEETKNIEKYLDPIKIKELGIAWNIADLIRKTKNPKRYLLEGQSLDDRNLRLDILNVIKGTGNIEKYLNPEIAKLLDLSEVQIIRLIKETKNIEKYLDPIKIKELGIMWNITDLIREAENPEKYLLEGQSLDDKNLHLNILNVIKGTGDIEKYLDPEMAERLGLRVDQIVKLIIIARKSRRIFR